MSLVANGQTARRNQEPSQLNSRRSAPILTHLLEISLCRFQWFPGHICTKLGWKIQAPYPGFDMVIEAWTLGFRTRAKTMLASFAATNCVSKFLAKSDHSGPGDDPAMGCPLRRKNRAFRGGLHSTKTCERSPNQIACRADGGSPLTADDSTRLMVGSRNGWQIKPSSMSGQSQNRKNGTRLR